MIDPSYKRFCVVAGGNTPLANCKPGSHRSSIEDLVLSERLYLLQIVLMRRLVSNSVELGETNEDLRSPNVTVFLKSLAHIENLHLNLFRDLESILLHWNEESDVGHLFTRNAQIMAETYRVYAEVMDSASEILSFAKAIPVSIVGAGCFVVTPLLKLRQYVSLLNRIAHSSSLLNENAENLGKAIVCIEDVIAESNEAREESMNMNATLRLESEFCHDIVLTKPNRALEIQGQLESLGRYTSAKRMYHLFSDALLQSKVSSEGYILENIFYKHEMKLVSAGLEGIVLNFSAKSKPMKLRAQSSEEQMAWCQAFSSMYPVQIDVKMDEKPRVNVRLDASQRIVI